MYTGLNGKANDEVGPLGGVGVVSNRDQRLDPQLVVLGLRCIMQMRHACKEHLPIVRSVLCTSIY